MRISVFRSPALQGTILALKGMDKELAKQIRQHIKAITVGEWKTELAQNSITRMENRVLVDSAKVSVSNQNITLKSGGTAKRLSGGARVRDVTSAVEFGRPAEGKSLSHSKTGKPYKRRHGTRFRPPNRKGYTVYPAAADAIPRIAALFVQTTVRTFHELVEKGASRG